MANIHDVAKRAAVSISTVSLVINGSPLVKEETREYVQRVIEEMGYVPNNDARSLRQGRTNNLGVIYMSENENDMFYSGYNDDHAAGLSSMSIVDGIMQYIMGTRYGVVSEHFCAKYSSEGDLPQIIKSKRVDGVFIVASPYAQDLIRSVQEIGLPLVTVGVDCAVPGVDSFCAESGEGVAMSLRHLAKMGHKHVCLINCSDVYQSAHTKRTAFLETADVLGMERMDEWEIICKTNCGKSSYAAFREYWERGNRPDGIIAGNGYMALGAMRYLYEQHVRIPDDVSIIVYEDTVLSGYAVPRLTSVNIGKEELGRRAAKALIARIQRPDGEPVNYVQQPYLVFRESVCDRRSAK